MSYERSDHGTVICQSASMILFFIFADVRVPRQSLRPRRADGAYRAARHASLWQKVYRCIQLHFTEVRSCIATNCSPTICIFQKLRMTTIASLAMHVKTYKGLFFTFEMKKKMFTTKKSSTFSFSSLNCQF